MLRARRSGCRQDLDIGAKGGGFTRGQAAGEQLDRYDLAALLVVGAPHGAKASATDVSIEDVIADFAASLEIHT